MRDKIKSQSPFKNFLEQTKARATLSALAVRHILTPERFLETVNGRYGITVPEQPKNYAAQCFSYALGVESISAFTASHFIPFGVERLDFEPRAGDLIWYGTVKNPLHAGVILEDGRIRSQWGSHGVFDHPYNSVPLCYGFPMMMTSFGPMPSRDDVLFVQEESTKRLSSLLFQAPIDIKK